MNKKKCCFCKVKKCVLGQYPCNDHLNNALRFLLKEKETYWSPQLDSVVVEITEAINKGSGVIFEDINAQVNECVENWWKATKNNG